MKGLNVVLTLAFCGLGALIGTSDAAMATKIDSPPKMDGKPDEALWKNAETFSGFVPLAGGAKSGETRFKIAYDNAWLYFGFDCDNSKLKFLKPKVTGHDKGACSDDSIELFLDPGTDGKMYYHYMLGWGGGKDERRVFFNNGDPDRELDWNVPWRATTTVRPDGWSAEIAVPLSVVVAYGDFAKIRFNVCRNKRVPNIDGAGVIVDERLESAVWAPVARSFHEPGAFRPLAALKIDKLETPAMATIEDVRVLPYRSEKGQTVYDAEVTLRNETAKGGVWKIAVIDQVPEAPAETRVYDIAPGDWKTLRRRFAVPTKTMAWRQVQVALMDAATGEVYQKTMATDTSALRVMSAYLDRNYYTTETSAAVVCAIGIPRGATSAMSVTVADKSGRILVETRAVCPETTASFSTATLPMGTSTLTVSLRENGRAFYDVPLPFVKRQPAPGLEWKVDRTNRTLLNNGAPFFAFGVVTRKTGPDDEIDFKTIADLGFNFVFLWKKLAVPEEIAAYAKNAEKYRLYLMPAIDDICCPKLDDKFRLKAMSEFLGKDFQKRRWYTDLTSVKCGLINEDPELSALTSPRKLAVFEEYYRGSLPGALRAVDAIKTNNRLLGYFIFDEPVPDHVFPQSALGREFYRELQAADGYHPVLVNYSSHIPEGKQYVDWCDILATDPYWVPGGTGIRGTVNFVSKIVTETDRRAEEFRKVTFTVPMAELWSGCRKRPLSAAEQWCQSYLALIHGAKGLLYFFYPIRNAANREALKALAKQIEVLGPCVVAPNIAQTIAYKETVVSAEKPTAKEEPAVFDGEKGRFPDIQVRVFRKDAKSPYVLLAANSQWWPVKARFFIKGLKEPVRGLFDEKTYAVADEAFADALGKYAVRAYVFDLPEGAGPVGVTVCAYRDKREGPPRETALAMNCRTDRGNVFPNPNFEEETVPGYFDYYAKYSVGETSVDTEIAWSGKKSCRLTKRPKDEFASVWAYCSPQSGEPGRYVFSCWLKGGKDGMNAWFRGFNEKFNKKFTVTDQWKRYVFTDIIPANCPERTSYELRLLSDGSLWVDALQLEKGDKPTDFKD